MAAYDAGTTPTNGSMPEMRSANLFAIERSPLLAAKSPRALTALSGKLQR
jgi:hypothetical protein